MSDEIESIHGLHVVNFDSKINLSESSEEIFKIDDTVHANNTQENLKPPTFNASTNNPACKKIQSIFDTALWSSRSRENNAVKSFPKKTTFSPLKKFHHKRTINIKDLKQKPTSNNFVFSKRASQTSMKHKRKGNQKVKPCNELSNSHKLQVLFSSKTKNDNTIRQMTNKISNQSFCRECKRLDLFYDSKSSGDFFGFSSNNNTRKSRFCYHLLTSQSKRLFPPYHFNYRNYRQHEDYFRKSRIEDVNSYITGSYGYSTIPAHYNLVELPCDFEPCHKELRTFKLFGDVTDRNDPCSKCSCVRERVSVPSSCFSICRKDADCVFDSLYISNPNIELQRDEIYNERTNDSTLKHHDCINCIKPISLRNIDLAEQPLSLVKSTLRYILFVLVVIAWSPCIITLCLYLLIIYPLRPQNIYNDYNETGDICCPCGSCFKCRHNFLLPIFRYFVRFGKKIPYAYNALYPFLKEKIFIKPCPCLSRIYSYRQPRCKHGRLSYPNPKNKYILYFSRHRGWLMKPIRRSVKKNYYQSNFMNYQFRQKEIRNFSKTRKEHNDCACDIVELENKTVYSNKNSVKMPKMISKKNSPIQNKPSSKQKFIHEMPKIEDCYLSSIYELKCKKRFEGLPPCIQAPRNDILIKCPEKTPKKVSYKGNLSSPPLNVRDSLYFNKSCQRQMTNSGELPSGFSCTCCHKKKENLKTKGKVRPNACNYKMYESKGHKLSSNQRIRCLCQSVRKSVKGTVKDLGSQPWACYICDHLFALRKRPCFWIYSLCTSFYPYFVIILIFFKNFIHVLILMFSICIWCPLIFCSYIFYSLCCRCLIYGIVNV